MYRIRSVTANDYEKCKSIKPAITNDIFEARIASEKEGKARFLILEVEDTPICLVLLKWVGKETHKEYPDIEDLYTRENERGKGYGAIMVSECERLSNEKGFNKIGLAVNPDENDKAHQLYLKLGYRDLNEPKYVDGIYNGVKDWVIDMEKDI